MTRIEDLFAEAVERAEVEAPPTRLRAAHLFAAGRRRRTWRTAALSSLVAATVAGAAGVVVAGGPLGVPRPEVSWPEPSPKDGPNGVVREAHAADRDHLYVVRNECYRRQQNVPNPDTCPADELVVSSDGGRTWSERTLLGRNDTRLTVLGVDVLMTGPANFGITPNPASDEPMQVTVDGGEQWRDLKVSTEPLADLPSGRRPLLWNFGAAHAQLAQYPVEGRDVLRLAAFDEGAVRPLAVQPPLAWLQLANVPADRGIWVTGYDPTGAPAVSVSRDDGRSWQTEALPGWPKRSELADPATPLTLFTNDGVTIYVFAGAPRDTPTMLVSTDGGQSWQPGDPTRRLAEMDAYRIANSGFVLPDNRHVAVVDAADENGARVRLLAAQGTGPYAEIDTPTGISARAVFSVRAVAGGGYVTADPAGIYESDDGLTWRRLPTPK